MTTDSPPGSGGTDAGTVGLAVEPDSDRVRDAVAEASYRRYLRRAREGPVTAGDTWAEFVSGGCGARTPVTIRVLAVEGGERVGRGTAFEWE